MAMIMALMIMMVLGTLAGAVIMTSVATNSSSTRDAQAASAIQAAEAGLKVATYRLNMLNPDAAHCVGVTVALPANGYCQDVTETLGNGASYTYYTTPVLGSGNACVGLPLSGSAAISQRCVTAVGTANGVSERAQVRVAAFGAVPLFPYNGIIGLKGVSISNNVSINGYVASNGAISESNNASMLGYVLGPGGSFSKANNAVSGTVTQLTPQQGPIVLGPVDPGNSAQAANNSNFRITNYLANPAHPTAPFDTASNVSFNATTRVLSMSNNASLTLGGGIYNFCQFTASNNASITLAAGVKTQIFIDSPDDPNSGCAPGTGGLSVSNNSGWMNNSNDPTALQIYVYGLNNGSSVVNFSNNGAFYGLLYAPQSTLNLSNNAAFWGGIAGNTVNLSNNFAFNWGTGLSTLQSRTTGLYYRTAWAQCTATPATSDPGSGCG
jgi:hypothetical protein